MPAPVQGNRGPAVISEEELKVRDGLAAGIEYDDIIYDWYAWIFPWRDVYTENELEGLKEGETPDPYKHLMNVDVAKMMSKIDEVNSERGGKFGFLPQMCKNSKCQLGALASQSFAERMNSAANLLVTKTEHFWITTLLTN